MIFELILANKELYQTNNQFTGQMGNLNESSNYLKWLQLRMI